MNQIAAGSVDFAVLGATPLARLVAGLLASVHGKTVAFVGDSQAGFRLPRGVDLSVAPLTRPETWSLLGHGVSETMKLLTRAAGKGCWSRIDPILFAETAAGRTALAHMRNAAAGFGHAIEPLASGQLGPGRDGIVVRDAVLLQRQQLEPALDQWLDQVAVRRLAVAGTAVTLRRDGSSTIEADGSALSAERTLFIDDEALLAQLTPQVLAPLFAVSAGSTILTEPVPALAAPALLQVDNGLSLTQRSNRGVVAMAMRSADASAPGLAALLSAHGPLHRAGQTSFSMLRSHDGAPVIGRVNDTGPMLVGDLGPTGVFLAPALARWLCGVAQDEEAAYFAARAPGRSRSPSLVADYAPVIEVQP